MRSTVSANSQCVVQMRIDTLAIMRNVLVFHVVFAVDSAMGTTPSRLHSLVLLRAPAVVGKQSSKLR